VHAARPQRAHGALEEPTALPQRSYSALSNMYIQNKCCRMEFLAIAGRLHSVSTALLVTAQRAPRRSVTFLNAVKTL